MSKSENTSYNPFGEKGTSYTPEAAEGYHITVKSSWVRWVSIALFFIVAMFIVVLITNFFFTSSQRNNAVESLNAFNSESEELHSIITSEQAKEDFLMVAESEEASEEMSQMARDVHYLIAQISDIGYIPLDESMSNQEAYTIVTPYYAMCDYITIMGEGSTLNTGDYGDQCNVYSEVAIDMMGKIITFNDLRGGIAGFFNPWIGDALPDVTA